jgi:hypothetical protein
MPFGLDELLSNGFEVLFGGLHGLHLLSCCLGPAKWTQK